MSKPSSDPGAAAVRLRWNRVDYDGIVFVVGSYGVTAAVAERSLKLGRRRCSSGESTDSRRS